MNTPAPDESRGIYGFTLFLMVNAFIVSYFAWTVGGGWVEGGVIGVLGWYEPPQPWWGVAVPAFLCTTLAAFAFVLYPAMHSLHDPKLHDLSAFTDSYALPLPDLPDDLQDDLNEDAQSEDDEGKAIPGAGDMDLSSVCRLLYLNTPSPS